MNFIHDEIFSLIKFLNSSEPSITEALKRVRAISKYYNDPKMLTMIEKELLGFKEGDEIPDYRKIKVIWYSDFVKIDPIGFGGAIKQTGTEIIDTLPYNCFQGIDWIEKNSNENSVKLQVKLDKNYQIAILGDELKKIINWLIIKMIDYLNEKVFRLKNLEEKTILVNILNQFHKVAKFIINN